MTVFQAKINASGRILVPASLRRKLNLQSDDDVLLHVENNHLIITPLKQSLHHVQNKIQLHNLHERKLTDILQALREENDS